MSHFASTKLAFQHQNRCYIRKRKTSHGTILIQANTCSIPIRFTVQTRISKKFKESQVRSKSCSHAEMDKTGTTSSSSSSMQPRVKKRHCAYCLVEVMDAKACAKCKRRAYCSKECQTLDWTAGKKDKAKGGVGQGHKKWCGIDYGEEDLDWVVVPIEGKGLGIRALRDIPALYRIIVEGWLTFEDSKGNPRISELTPEGESDIGKFSLNSGIGSMGPLLGLRCSRVNHDCDPNTSCAVDRGFKALILHSNRDIKAGEEICQSYCHFNFIPQQLLNTERCSSQTVRELLKQKWKIECPSTCICFDPAIQEAIDQCFVLHQKQKEQPNEQKIQALEEIIELMSVAKCTPSMFSSIWTWIVTLAERDPSTVPIADKYAAMVVRDFSAKVFHPDLTKAAADKLENTERFQNLCLE